MTWPRGACVADGQEGVQDRADAAWPRLEEDLRAPVTSYLRARGLEVRDEVWINGRIADLFAYDKRTTLAVELKLADWKNAAVQAMAYQLAAEFTYVALPLEVVPKVMRQASALRRHGIGLLAVAPGVGGGFRRADQLDEVHAVPEAPLEPDVRELIAPEPSARYLPFLADKVVRDAKRPKRTGSVMPRDGWW